MEKYNAKEQKMVEFRYRNSGEMIRFPVGTIYGAQEGPTLLVVGGMHGSEFCGIQGALEVYMKTDPSKMKGKLVVVPIYNMPAFLNHTGFAVPQDGKNPMSTFPGRPDGTFGEVMAYHFIEEVVNPANPDFVLELHGGDIPEALVPFVIVQETGNKEVDSKIKEMTNAYNIAYLLHSKETTEGLGSMFGKLAERGIPSMLAESGQQGILDFDFVKIHETGILNVMKKMGMIEGDVVDTVKRVSLENYGSIYNEIPGMWYPCVKLSQIVKKDEKVGEIRDYFGNRLSDIKAPVDGLVVAIRTSPSVGKTHVLVELHYVV